jgi:hypothetical protein
MKTKKTVNEITQLIKTHTSKKETSPKMGRVVPRKKP